MITNRDFLYSIIYILLYGGVFGRYVFGGQSIFLLVDFILLYLMIFAKIPKNTEHITKYIGNIPQKILGLFLFWGFVSYLFHVVNPLSFLWGFRMEIRYFILMLMIYKMFNWKDVIRCYKIFYHAFYLNAFFCMVDFVMGKTGDDMGGIFTGNSQLSLFFVISTMVHTGEYIRKKLSKARFAFFFILCYTIAIWAEIKMLYFVLPFVVYLTHAVIQRFKLSHFIVLCLLGVTAIPIMEFALSFYYDKEYIENTLDTQKLEEYNSNSYGFTDESMNRGTCIALTNEYILTTDRLKIMGFGLGNGSVSEMFSTDIYDDYKLTFYYYFAPSYILVETGWMGLALFILLYMSILYSFYRLFINSTTSFVRYCSALGMLLAFLTFLFIYYNPLPYIDYYIPYLFWGLLLVAIRENRMTLKK